MRTQRAELRGLEDDLDRVEDRLHDDEFGVFRAGVPADEAELEAAGLPERAAIFWRRHNGLSIAHDWSVIWPLERIREDAAMRGPDGEQMRTWRIGHYAGQPLRLAQDPWMLGAEVLILDGAQAAASINAVVDGAATGAGTGAEVVDDEIEDVAAWVPWASSLARGVRVMLALTSVLFTDRGSLRRGMSDPRGNLLPEVERRLLRRQLDIDEDAPQARLQLSMELADQGEEHGALRELRQVVKRAPTYEHAWLELGWTAARLGRFEEARRAWERGLAASEVRHADALLHASLAALAPADPAAEVGPESHRLKALDLVPDLESALRADAKAHHRAGHRARALQLQRITAVLAGAAPVFEEQPAKQAGGGKAPRSKKEQGPAVSPGKAKTSAPTKSRSAPMPQRNSRSETTGRGPMLAAGSAGRRAGRSRAT